MKADQERRAEVVRLLANDALEATQESGAEAAMLLIDTALTIALTRLGPAGAHEMSGMLVGYMMQQSSGFLDGEKASGQ